MQHITWWDSKKGEGRSGEVSDSGKGLMGVGDQGRVCPHLRPYAVYFHLGCLCPVNLTGLLLRKFCMFSLKLL